MACHGRHALDDIHAHIIFILEKNSSSSSAKHQISQILKLFQPHNYILTYISPIKRVSLGWTSHGPAAPTCHHSTHPVVKKKPSDSISFTCANRDLLWQHVSCLHTYIYTHMCLYLYVYTHVDDLRKTQPSFSVVSSQCSFSKALLLIAKDKSLRRNRIPVFPVCNSQHSRRNIWRLFFPVSTVCIPLPFLVNWRLANGTK